MSQYLWCGEEVREGVEGICRACCERNQFPEQPQESDHAEIHKAGNISCSNTKIKIVKGVMRITLTASN